jgi:hypothetical protein
LVSWKRDVFGISGGLLNERASFWSLFSLFFFLRDFSFFSTSFFSAILLWAAHAAAAAYRVSYYTGWWCLIGSGPALIKEL